MLKRLAPLALAFTLSAAAAAQEAGANRKTHAAPEAPRASASDELFAQLLRLPAPPPRGSEIYGEEPEKGGRPAEFFDEQKPPPDDAPSADLVAYWTYWIKLPRFNDPAVTQAVRRRLLDACEDDPSILAGLKSLLPDGPRDAERVKKLYDAAQGSEAFDDQWRESVYEWLKYHSAYFSSELLAEARKAADRGSGVANGEALKALAKFDWESAEPLLDSLLAGGQPRAAVLALALIRRHALESKDDAEGQLRARLQAIASDRNALAFARYTAVEELTTTEWAGRDEWYLSLFADETLMRPTEGTVLFHPLTTLFDSDPDRWIPVMAKLVESKDEAVRHNAAYCLAYHAMYHPRRDAILPVLPWLYDPDWLPIRSSEYTMFVGKLDEADVPESVPALIWFVEHNDNQVRWIAATLGHYKDPRAVPALRRALAGETTDYGRRNIFEALADCGGLSEEEQLAGLEAFVAKLDTDGGREDVSRYRNYDEETLPLPVTLGHYLALRNEVPDSLARAALARAEALRKKSPARSRLMLGIIEGWQSKQVELDMVRRIGAGAADADTVAKALERSARLRESVRPELNLLAGGGGTPQGVAAVILEDEALARGVLESNDAGARLALLACARLTQMPLPVAQVGALLRSKNTLLALAAERYLLAEDSAEARELLLARHPGEAFVTGWRENVLVNVGDFSAMGRAEEKLRAELYRKDDAPLEIIALTGNEERPSRVLRVYASRAVYTEYEDASRYRERTAAPEEVERFKNLLAASSILDSGPRLGECHYGCRTAELFSVKREGGRRVFTHGSGDESQDFTHVFDAFSHEGAKVRYDLEDELDGLEILYSNESLSAEDVWQKGGDLRLLVRRGATPEEKAQEQAEEEEDDEDFATDGDPALVRARNRRREREREKERVSWRALAAGKLGATVARPEGYSTLDEAALDVDEDEFSPDVNSNLARAAAGDSYVLAGGEDEGIWKKSPGHAAVRVGGDGVYADPVVTPDGTWAVAAKAAEDDWSDPNGVVRFDLRTGREYRVDVPPAKQFAPVAYVAAHGKVLLRRSRDEYGDVKESDGPAAPEFYLLDPATGRTQQVSGVFEPLLQKGKRALQPTGRPDEFWAAVPDRAKNETRVGLYNVRDFSFRALLTVPHIQFDSFEMWADESASKLLVVYKGQLLRLPLRDSRVILSSKGRELCAC